MERKLLPVSESNFEELRSRDQYYVDKTHLLYTLLHPNPWPPKFLSRPRRFGKSLFLDTIRCLYEGKEELFEGLYIHDKWDWDPEKALPVIKLDFSESNPQTNAEFRGDFWDYLEDFVRSKGLGDVAEKVVNRQGTPGGSLGNVLRRLSAKENKKLIVLIDEYDAPLISIKNNVDEYKLTHSDMRGILKSLKKNRDYIEFIFMTGILKLSQHDFFSAANIFTDISLRPDYNEICGYTEKELLQIFQPELERKDLNPEINIDTLRAWYDGYRWGAPTHLYNPHDILRTFDENKISAWWTTYGLTTIAINQIKKNKNFTFEDYTSGNGEDALKYGLSLTSETISLDSVLLQTGYLTLRPAGPEKKRLHLEVPNLEVKQALARLRIFIKSQEKVTEVDFSTILDMLAACEFDELHEKIRQILSTIVYDEKPEELRERHFSILIRSILIGAGLPDSDIRTEVHTQEGRIDMEIYYRPTNTYYIAELKVLGIGGNKPGDAMKQLKAKHYAARYKEKGRVFLLGFEFIVTPMEDKPDALTVTLENLDWEPYKP